MSDLISRSAIMSRIEREYSQWGEDYDIEQILGDIEDFPTAFDLESVIDTFETYKSQQAENEMLSDNGKWLAQRIIEECEKIIKSASNATNGKNGG